MSEAAVRFALSNPSPSTVLVVFSYLAQVLEATAAVDTGSLSEAALQLVRDIWGTAVVGG